MITDTDMALAIRTAIRESGFTPKELAKAFNVTEQAVSNWVRMGKIDRRKLPTLASLTGKPLAYFGMVEESLPPMAAALKDPDYIRFRALNIAADVTTDTAKTNKRETVREVDVALLEIQRKLGCSPAPDRVKLFTMRGTSMQPILDDGDVALIDTNISSFDGDAIYLIEINNSIKIRLLQMRPDGVHVISTSTDRYAYPVTENQESLHILGKVLGVIEIRQL